MELTHWKRLSMAAFVMAAAIFLATSVAQAGSLLDEMRDTCGTTYANRLATCTPFRCTKPVMMFGFPSEDELKKMLPERQQKMRKAMAAAKRKIAAMSTEERAAMKVRMAKMTSTLEIKGFDEQGRCQTVSMVIPVQRIDCTLDKSILGKFVDYTRLMTTAKNIGMDSTSHLVNGKMVTQSTTTIDEKKIADPWMDALHNGQCKILKITANNGWVSMEQMNRMAQFELNLSEHGKPVDGHIQILNSADGKILFDKDVKTSHEIQKISLIKPGTVDIKAVSANSQLPPVWLRGIELRRGNLFKKNIEFYAMITGMLKLTVNINGKLSKNAAIYIKNPDTKKWLTVFGEWRVRKKPIFYGMPASIKLAKTQSGRYQVSVAAVPGSSLRIPDNATYKDFLLTIKNGEIAERTIDFGVTTTLKTTHMGMLAMPTVRAGETPQVQPPVEKASEQSANTLFILDASGSMWGQINGKPKITIAKEVMAKLVPELPDNSRIGLIAYGHRRKGDCNDVETLVKLGGNHKQAVLGAVKGLNAKGKTPLTRSVNQAIDMLRQEENASTVVLVSDGIESCGGDPCAAVKAAKASGVNFILHTVGFGLSKQESTQLQCMAKAGGGEYFQANNAEELLKSARKAVQPMGVLKLTVKVNGKVNDLMYHIEDASTGKIIRQPVLPTSSGSSIQLPSGKYNVFVLPAGVSGAAEQTLSLRMKAGEVIKKTLSFGKGVLHLTVMVNGKPAHALIHVEESSTHKGIYESSVFGYDTPLAINLAEGKVDIVAQVGGRDLQERRAVDVNIVAGKTTEQIISFEVALTVPEYVTHLGAGEWTGWDSSEGSMGLLDAGGGKFFGFYNQEDHGRLLLQRNESDVTGYWVENNSHQQCASERDGSRYWGRIKWKFDDKFSSFSGSWSYCDADPSGSRWTGKRSAVKSVTTQANGMEQDTDRPGGGDFRHVIPAADDPVLCQKACRDDTQCKAWTYVKPNTIQGAQPNCWLKSAVPAAVANSCCVSGKKWWSGGK